MAAIVTVVLPQHAAAIARVFAATVVVLTGVLVLRAVAPVAAREPVISALDRVPGPRTPVLDPHGLRDARRDLDRPAAAGSVPPVVRDRLLVAADRRGMPLNLHASTGSVRDPAAVARIVHRTLDALESADPTGANPHGHH